MAYTFRQTGSEIQDILDQVPENTDDIASLNATLTNMSAEYVNENGDAVTTSSGTWTMVQAVDLPPGVVLLYGGVSFASNATGYRQIEFGSSADGVSVSRQMVAINAVASGGQNTNIQTTRIVSSANGFRYYLWARQNSGGNLSVSPFVRYIRLR